MTPFPERGWRPSPQQLAAYADGELPLSERERIEEWLSAHPEGMAAVEAHWQFARLWNDTQPPSPTELDWALAEGRVRERRRQGEAARRARLAVGLAGLPRMVFEGRFGTPAKVLLSAAAAVAVVLLIQGRPAPAPHTPAAHDVADDYPVVSGADVQIISMDPADRGALVVPDDNFAEPIILASRAEVTVNLVRPDRFGRVPRVHALPEVPPAILIVDPVTPGRPRP